MVLLRIICRKKANRGYWSIANYSFGKISDRRVITTKENKKIYQCKFFNFFFRLSFEHALLACQNAVSQQNGWLVNLRCSIDRNRRITILSSGSVQNHWGIKSTEGRSNVPLQLLWSVNQSNWKKQKTFPQKAIKRD